MQSLLQKRWRELWNRIGAQGNADIPLADLRIRYGEPWRAYHTLAHIEEMFSDFDEFCTSCEFLLEHRDAVSMAIFYHDAVYDTTARNNEEKSAELFRTVAEWSGIEEVFTESVARAIIASKHTELPKDVTCRVLCDIDLAILGKPEAAFAEYERKIRKEYGWVAEDQFRAGRLAVIEGFRSRPFIYATQFFREKYGRQARLNIFRSIERLTYVPMGDLLEKNMR
jgi:predicted metal-dependent HD superfamily phosphohydrolase